MISDPFDIVNDENSVVEVEEDKNAAVTPIKLIEMDKQNNIDVLGVNENKNEATEIVSNCKEASDQLPMPLQQKVLKVEKKDMEPKEKAKKHVSFDLSNIDTTVENSDEEDEEERTVSKIKFR